jgi:hypothetical protein
VGWPSAAGAEQRATAGVTYEEKDPSGDTQRDNLNIKPTEAPANEIFDKLELDDRYYRDYKVPGNAANKRHEMNQLKSTTVFLALHKNLFIIEGRNIHGVEQTSQIKNVARVKEK